MKPARLLSKQSKKIEQEVVSFYMKAGAMVNLNPRMTEIFAYLRIYNSLTQEQLGHLTGISAGTVSTTLQVFLQTGIINRTMIPGTHTHLYRIKPERVDFVYTPSTQIMDDLEELDSYIVKTQAELQKMQTKYPTEVQFLHLRLNGIRNYIEAQRRQIHGKQKYSFLPEDGSELFPLSKGVAYHFDTEAIERTVMGVIKYYRHDSVKNRLLGLFFTHRSATQQTLIDNSGFSRSTVSRFLKEFVGREYIQALPREYRRPRVYYLESFSRSILAVILNTDNFIYSSVQRFQEILDSLQSKRQIARSEAETALLHGLLQDLVKRIETFKKNNRFLRQAYQDLCDFLGKDPSELLRTFS
jgi:DNA-binding MarR family transcriptional regulator